MSVYKGSHRGPYFFFQLVVEKTVHQDFAVVKDLHPGVDRFGQKKLAFAHIDSDQVVRKFNMP